MGQTFRLQSTVLNQYIIIRKVVTRDPVTESLQAHQDFDVCKP